MERRKIEKKAFKWTIFLIILLPMSLMYLISSDKLLLMIEEGPENHVSTLISLLILQEFSILFCMV
jgi:predicted ATPase